VLDDLASPIPGYPWVVNIQLLLIFLVALAFLFHPTALPSLDSEEENLLFGLGGSYPQPAYSTSFTWSSYYSAALIALTSSSSVHALTPFYRPTANVLLLEIDSPYSSKH